MLVKKSLASPRRLATVFALLVLVAVLFSAPWRHSAHATSAALSVRRKVSEKLARIGAAAAPPRESLCSQYNVRRGAWALSERSANVRAAADVRLKGMDGVVVKGRVWHATGRPFIVAKRAHLGDKGYRACFRELGREMAAMEVLQIALRDAGMMGGLSLQGGVDGRLVEREPSWAEEGIEPELRLPWAAAFVGRDGLGKLYLDVEEGWNGISAGGKRPAMKKEEHGLWGSVGVGFFGGGRHLDWGTGSSSHFACSIYRWVNAIDSQVSWCGVTQKGISKEQSWCRGIKMNCLDVGQLEAWGIPKFNVTDEKYYFHRYVAAIDGFKDSPYYDTILVDGRFRTACAIKALGHLRRDSLLLMHDYPRRYAPVLNYVKLVAKNSSLAVFAPREDVKLDAEFDYRLYPDYGRR